MIMVVVVAVVVVPDRGLERADAAHIHDRPAVESRKTTWHSEECCT